MNIEDKKKIVLDLIGTFQTASKLSLSLRKKGLKETIKEDNTPVTNGDLEVNNLLIDKISKLPDSPGTQLQAYRDFRGIQHALNNQMLDQAMQQDIFLKASKLLGLLCKKQLMLESENEINLIVDFAIHDYYVEEKNAMQLFL